MAEKICCDCAASPTRRMIGSTKWIVPAAVLALMPKCPMCVAAYIALATGCSVSLAAATWIRAGLLVGCLSALGYLSLRVAIHAIDWRRFSTRTIPSRADLEGSIEFFSEPLVDRKSDIT